MSARSITLKTYTQTSCDTKEPRNVTIWYSPAHNEFSLLGGLPHGTELVIDQKLVNQLQELLNDIKAGNV